jgi:hypothetical protein
MKAEVSPDQSDAGVLPSQRRQPGRQRGVRAVGAVTLEEAEAGRAARMLESVKSGEVARQMALGVFDGGENQDLRGQRRR